MAPDSTSFTRSATAAWIGADRQPSPVGSDAAAWNVPGPPWRTISQYSQ